MSTESDIDRISASTIFATATSSGCHLLRITGYSRSTLLGNGVAVQSCEFGSTLLGNGVAVQSCEFEAGGHRWCILYYPRSKSRPESIFVALKLTTKAVSRPVNTNFRFTLVPHHGKPAPATTYCKNYRVSFDYTGHYWVSQLTTREELESSEYLVDDSFSIRCDVHAVHTSAVADQFVHAHDLERMGLACGCSDDLCKRRHAASWGLEKENAPVSGSTTAIRRRVKAAWLRLFRRKH
uniref:Uncharacterized protein n=1 Tax=Avena sativa TaxID=4498 RepID=A0ACD5Z0C7_AVESA